MSRRLIAWVLGASLAASCGSSAAGPGWSEVHLDVFAAASLSHVFPQIARAFSRDHRSVSVRFSFAGTDAVVTQLEEGAPADVFAGASASYGERLFADHLVDRPVAFCTNRLIVILPVSNPAGVASLRDLAKPGVKLVVGAETVPVGAYTRKVLANLDGVFGRGYATKVLANVVSNEDNVEGVLTKVRLGEADAGFVYVTDAGNAGSDVKVMALPPAAQAVATYPIAVLSRSGQRTLAAEFVGFVLGSEGQRILAEAGFGPAAAPVA